MASNDTTPSGRSQREAVFRRPVSPPEWFYLAAQRLGRAMVQQLVVEGDPGSEPTPQALRAAVAQAAVACPGSRLVRRGRHWVDSGRPPQVLVAAPGSAPDAELRTGTAVLAEPLDAEAGVGCEVVLLPGAADRPSALLFRVSHAVMDGHGAQLWVQEVFRALRGEQPRPARSPLTDQRLLAEVGATGRRPALLLDQPSPLGPLQGAAAGRPGAVWRRRTLPGRHRSLTARLAQAFADATGAPRARLMVPVDLRRHIATGAAATGNLSLPVFLDLPRGGDWRTAHAELLGALAEHRELSGGFESGLARLPLPVATELLRAGQAVASRRDRHMASAIVSHLGRAELSHYSGGGFTARSLYLLPVHAPLVPVSCAAVELADRTEVTVSCQGPDRDLAERADELMDRLAATITGSAPAAAARRTAPDATAPEAATPAARTATPPAAAPDATVVELFRAQAARTPQAVALDGPAGPVSYAELDRRSDAVAAELLRRGTARAAVVGLLVERSPAGLAALWGILKAGACYLPLDPRHPDARIADVLQEAGAVACLTERHLEHRLTAATDTHVLAVESILTAATEAAAPTTAPAIDPAQLAYVIYTSGSTGRPKGVQIEHRSLAAFAQWATELCGIDADTRFAFLGSYSFDVSAFPIFLPLLHGGTIVLVPDEPSRPALHELVTRHRPDTFAITPSHLELIEHYDLELTGVRTLMAVGEQFTRAAADRARRRVGPDTRIINGYGPTEATVICLAHVLDGSESGPVVPIGLPGPFAQVELVELVDGEEQPIGPERTGAVGEILVSGLQLARGYLGRPDLDAERFPVGADQLRRYRTGDLARRLPGGALEFIGRNDDQVKIAGHRIEPAEVQAVLERHPAVRRAGVVARTRSGGSVALCAYVLPATDQSEAHSEAELPAILREFTAELLPAHLVPAVVLVVAELPSTVSGKTDFAALPDPFAGEADPSADASADEPSDSTPPTAEAAGPAEAAEPEQSDVTDRLTALWSRMLGTDRARLGPDSDFQELGGDSLAVLEMLSTIADELLTAPQASLFTTDLRDHLAELTIQRVGDAIHRARRTAPRQATGASA
ncbi:non-ribosomal peptide synthetase [Kitasatospora sp. NBC_01250]|uniref:non-ribosomal peptide synthetase n=1 Tax=Kitasatospora sp. NBC_01250 TaxID=2903571 RepID=UPI002E3236F1|nr:non-ribosomal peptide synthetase [Kitasatospora sp. NBC_01250]